MIKTRSIALSLSLSLVRINTIYRYNTIYIAIRRYTTIVMAAIKGRRCWLYFDGQYDRSRADRDCPRSSGTGIYWDDDATTVGNVTIIIFAVSVFRREDRRRSLLQRGLYYIIIILYYVYNPHRRARARYLDKWNGYFCIEFRCTHGFCAGLERTVSDKHT